MIIYYCCCCCYRKGIIINVVSGTIIDVVVADVDVVVFVLDVLKFILLVLLLMKRHYFLFVLLKTCFVDWKFNTVVAVVKALSLMLFFMLTVD